MPGEIDFLSLLMPGLLPILAGSAVCFLALDLMLARMNFYRFTWHPSLFRVALFAALFSGAALLLLQ